MPQLSDELLIGIVLAVMEMLKLSPLFPLLPDGKRRHEWMLPFIGVGIAVGLTWFAAPEGMVLKSLMFHGFQLGLMALGFFKFAIKPMEQGVSAVVAEIKNL